MGNLCPNERERLLPGEQRIFGDNGCPIQSNPEVQSLRIAQGIHAAQTGVRYDLNFNISFKLDTFGIEAIDDWFV